MIRKIIDDKEFFWIKYEALLQDMPILKIKKDALKDRLFKLVDKRILEHKTIKKGGTYSCYNFGENYYRLIKDNKELITQGCVVDYSPPMEWTTEQNNLSTKENHSTKDNNELEANFNKLWEYYPKKENKNQAFKSYCNTIEEYKKLGNEEILINKAFWYKLVEYNKKIKEQNTEDKYIKQAYNFFNGALEDFSSSSELESYIKNKESEVIN